MDNLDFRLPRLVSGELGKPKPFDAWMPIAQLAVERHEADIPTSFWSIRTQCLQGRVNSFNLSEGVPAGDRHYQ
jgi:hypothetical protein